MYMNDFDFFNVISIIDFAWLQTKSYSMGLSYYLSHFDSCTCLPPYCSSASEERDLSNSISNQGQPGKLSTPEGAVLQWFYSPLIIEERVVWHPTFLFSFLCIIYLLSHSQPGWNHLSIFSFLLFQVTVHFKARRDNERVVKLSFDGTPNYFCSIASPFRMRAMLGDGFQLAKFILLFRDPVERAVSW